MGGLSLKTESGRSAKPRRLYGHTCVTGPAVPDQRCAGATWCTRRCVGRVYTGQGSTPRVHLCAQSRDSWPFAGGWCAKCQKVRNPVIPELREEEVIPGLRE